MCRWVRVCRCSRPNRCCIAFSYHKWSTRSFYSTSIHGVHSSLGSAPPPITFQWFPLILYTAVCAADCYHVQSSAPPPIYVYIHTQEHLFAVSSSIHAVLPSRPSLFLSPTSRRPKTTLTPLCRIYARTLLTNCTLALDQNPRDVSNLKSCFCSYSTG